MLFIMLPLLTESQVSAGAQSVFTFHYQLIALINNNHSEEMNLILIKSNHNKPSMLTRQQLDSHGKLTRVYCSKSAHRALGSVLQRTASDPLAVQLLSMTQGKLKPETFDQWLHIMALGQAQNQQTNQEQAIVLSWWRSKWGQGEKLLLIREISSLLGSSCLLGITTIPSHSCAILIFNLLVLCFLVWPI